MGGSADLAPSTKTLLSGYADFGSGQPNARNIRFGVREHAMGAIVNGMALHGGLLPYGATFFVFFGLHEAGHSPGRFDGGCIRFLCLPTTASEWVKTVPTHQPIEHLAAMRAIPHLTIIRPADANETAAAWKIRFGAEKPHRPHLDPPKSAHYGPTENMP